MEKNYNQMVSVDKMPRTVYDLVTRSMETLFPECVAIRAVAEDGQTVLEWTYAQMAEDIRRTVTYLKESIPDIKGKKVAILSRNCYEYGVLSFGTMLSGARPRDAELQEDMARSWSMSWVWWSLPSSLRMASTTATAQSWSRPMAPCSAP